MQNPDHQLAHCGVCGALPGDPCVTRYGREALQVHWGRTARSERLRAEREAAEGVQISRRAASAGESATSSSG